VAEPEQQCPIIENGMKGESTYNDSAFYSDYTASTKL